METTNGQEDSPQQYEERRLGDHYVTNNDSDNKTVATKKSAVTTASGDGQGEDANHSKHHSISLTQPLLERSGKEDNVDEEGKNNKEDKNEEGEGDVVIPISVVKNGEETKPLLKCNTDGGVKSSNDVSFPVQTATTAGNVCKEEIQAKKNQEEDYNGAEGCSMDNSSTDPCTDVVTTKNQHDRKEKQEATLDDMMKWCFERSQKKPKEHQKGQQLSKVIYDGEKDKVLGEKDGEIQPQDKKTTMTKMNRSIAEENKNEIVVKGDESRTCTDNNSESVSSSVERENKDTILMRQDNAGTAKGGGGEEGGEKEDMMQQQAQEPKKNSSRHDLEEEKDIAISSVSSSKNSTNDIKSSLENDNFRRTRKEQIGVHDHETSSSAATIERKESKQCSPSAQVFVPSPASSKDSQAGSKFTASSIVHQPSKHESRSRNKTSDEIQSPKISEEKRANDDLSGNMNNQDQQEVRPRRNTKKPQDENEKTPTRGRENMNSSKSSPLSSSPSPEKKLSERQAHAKQKVNPYLGKTVRVIRGQFEGLTGKIIQIHSRGWWSLDNPKMESRNIHPRYCELVDTMDQSEIDNFYKFKAKNRNLPAIILRQQGIQQKQVKKRNESESDNTKTAESQNPPKRPKRQAALKSKISMDRYTSASSRRESTTKPGGGASQKKVHKTKKVMISSTINEDFLQQGYTSISKTSRMTAFNNKDISSAININSFDELMKNGHLKSLPPDFKVEVFDRKRGRVLKGEDAIALKDLPAHLRRHAEYEPILPQVTSSSVESNLSSASTFQGNKPQEARSLISATVCRNVQPQIRVRASAVEGKRVKVINGPYKGLTGYIESCIPGNWYLITDLSKKNKFDLDYVVHAKNLKMLDEATVERTKTKSVDKATTQPGSGKGIGASPVKVSGKSLHSTIHSTISATASSSGMKRKSASTFEKSSKRQSKMGNDVQKDLVYYMLNPGRAKNG